MSQTENIIYKTIYKTYTPAVKRCQERYRKTEKGKIALRKASQNFYIRHKENLKKPVSCVHCGKIYSGLYIKKHIKKAHSKCEEQSK